MLELEPNEADKLPISIGAVNAPCSENGDRSLRDGNLEQVLTCNDRSLIGGRLGLSASDIADLSSVWQKLKNRRIGRRTDSERSARATVCV